MNGKKGFEDMIVENAERYIEGLKAIIERLDRIEKKIAEIDPRISRRIDGTPRMPHVEYYSTKKREE